jgi:hypothetical protein
VNEPGLLALVGSISTEVELFCGYALLDGG